MPKAPTNSIGLAEDLVLHSNRPRVGIARGIVVIDEAAILSLDADDAVHDKRIRSVRKGRGESEKYEVGTENALRLAEH